MIFVLVMNTFIVGNSIVRELQDSHGFTTISIPGLTWMSALRYVTSNIQRFSNSIVYVHIGPVRFSILSHSRSHNQCSLDRQSNNNPNDVIEPFRHRLSTNNINIVLCTIYPMDFTIYNNHISALARVNNANLAFDSEGERRRMRSMVVVENRRILDYKIANNMTTPYMHRRIFTRRNHAYRFRVQLLRDGLHPTRQIINDWAREIRRVNVINMGRLRRRFV